MTRAICIGECMVELRSAGGGHLAQAYAGDAYNTAVYLKRSAPEIDVQFLSVTGVDPLSNAMRAAWRQEGIDDACAWTVADKQPGLYLIETDANGERQFRYWRGESAARDWLQILVARGGADLLAKADLVYLSGISLAILSEADRAAALDLMASLKGRVCVAFDPNYRAALWQSPAHARDAITSAIGSADIVLPSQEDLERLYGAGDPQFYARRIKHLGAHEGAITTGPGRCVLVGSGWIDGPAATDVIDTSGAGDSFNGAYLAARLRGRSPRLAAVSGLELAAQVVGARGAVIPSKETLELY